MECANIINDTRSSKQNISDVFYSTFTESKSNTKAKGVLKIIEGPCMQMDAVNNNNRIYPKELVEKKIVNNENVQELIKNHSLLGEGCHPETRLETIYPNVCMSIEKLWIPDNDNDKLYGRFAILDTPIGRILNTLLDYGSKVGVSARAAGTSVVTPEGYELLDVDNYEFYTFDAVPEPGFSCARPSLVESRTRNNFTSYANYSKEELEYSKNFMEKANPEFFKKDVSIINHLLKNINENKTMKNNSNNKKDNSNEIKKLQVENKILRSQNIKKRTDDMNKIKKLEKTLEILKENYKLASDCNKRLMAENKVLTGLVNSQKKVLDKISVQKKQNLKCLKEAIQRRRDDLQLLKENKDLKQSLYDTNVKSIALETGVNESTVKTFYKNLNESTDKVTKAIKKMSPYLNESTVRNVTNVVESEVETDSSTNNDSSIIEKLITSSLL